MSVSAPADQVGYPDRYCLAELTRRADRYMRVQRYFDGNCPLPAAIIRARITNAYSMLMAFSQSNYGKLIVRAATGRMTVGGLRAPESARPAADRGWAIWQSNGLDAESRRAHDVIVTHGRVFANIWLDTSTGAEDPSILYETPDVMIVRYADGSRFERVEALRRWRDGETYCCTVYRADALYKWTSRSPDGPWDRREIADEAWPLTHEFGVVPVVEIATNGSIGKGCYGPTCHGDYEQQTGLLDRINLLEFLRLVIAFSQGFPLRVVIGGDILEDDERRPIAPFRLLADAIGQIEDPEARLAQFEAADIEQFGRAMDRDVEILAGICQTPAYFMKSMPIQNVAADAIRAADVSLVGRVIGHQPFVAEGHEETLRTALRVVRLELPQDAEIRWTGLERYNVAERADAFTKLLGGGQGLPWQAAAEIALDPTQDQLSRWETAGAGNAFLTDPAARAGAGA